MTRLRYLGSQVSKLKHFANQTYTHELGNIAVQCRAISFRLPWKKKSSGVENLDLEADKRRAREDERPDRQQEHLQMLARKKKTLTNRNPYEPPVDVEERVRSIARNFCDVTNDDSWTETAFRDNRMKFKVLTQMMSEFKRDIPCAELGKIDTVGDALKHFKTEVRVTSTYEDMAKMKLPPNVNIQLEAHRFDANRDTRFGGRTAFPGSDTIVKSIKFSRKYNSIRQSPERPGYVGYYDY